MSQSGTRRPRKRLCASMFQAMNRLAAWLWTLSPLAGRNNNTKIKKKRRRRSNTESKLFEDTSDDIHTTTQPSVRSPLMTNCSLSQLHNVVCTADTHSSGPPGYVCKSTRTTRPNTEVHQNVETQEDCDEVDGHPKSLSQPLLPDLQQMSSLTVYFNPKGLSSASELPGNTSRTLKKKVNSTKNIVDHMPGCHRFPDELKSVGQSSLLCPVHYQTNDQEMEKTPGCRSSSGQSLGISCDKPTTVTKDPLALGRQGSDYFECETEPTDKCGTENIEESCPRDVFLSNKMSMTERQSEISCAQNKMFNECISDKDTPSQSHTVMHGNEPYSIGDASIITASSQVLERDNDSNTHRETSMVGMDESGNIHMLSIGSATAINQSIPRPLSRTGSLSSIDSVTHVSCDSGSPEFISDVQDCFEDSRSSEAKNPGDHGQKNSDTLEGLWLELPGSDTDAFSNNTPSTEVGDCNETHSFTVVEGAEICNDGDGILVSEVNVPNGPHTSELRANSSENEKSEDARQEKQQIPKAQSCDVGYDTDNTKSDEDGILASEASIQNGPISSETKADTFENSKSEDAIQEKKEIPKPQSRDSEYDTDKTKSKTKGSSSEKAMTDVEKRRNALMKRLAERTKASLAPYCSSGMYAEPKANDNKKSVSKGNENVTKADLIMNRKEKQVPDPISLPQIERPLQKSPQCGDSETAIVLTSANDGQWAKVLQDPVQRLDTASSEHFMEIESSFTVLDEDLYGDGLNVGEPDGMDEYFATAVTKTVADGEGYDETDSSREHGGAEVHESHAPNVVEIQNLGSGYDTSSTGAHLCNDFALMRAPSLSTDQPVGGTAHANPSFKTKKSRFLSFGGKIWKLSSPTVEEIVYCGFHYLGPGDKTQCFSCGIILMEWEISDIPVEEHLRHSPHCSFIIGVASLHKQWLSPFIEGAIDIVKGFNQFENDIIDTAIEQLDVKDVHIFTAPQLLDEVYLIEEEKEKEKEDLSILYMYGIQGATCQDITDEILHEELLHKLAPFDADSTDDDQLIFEPIEGLGAKVADLGAGFDSFLEISAVHSNGLTAPMVTYENGGTENPEAHENGEEKYFSIHPETEHHNNVADKPGLHPLGQSDPRELEVRHDSGCISGGGIPLHEHEPIIEQVPKETCSDDDGSLYDTDYYSEEESLDDVDEVDQTPAPEPLPITEEQKAEIEARLINLRQRNEELRLWSACKVCLVRSVTEFYIDCGHLAVCSSCSSQLQTCPICRKRITNSMTVYLH